MERVTREYPLSGVIGNARVERDLSLDYAGYFIQRICTKNMKKNTLRIGMEKQNI